MAHINGGLRKYLKQKCCIGRTLKRLNNVILSLYSIRMTLLKVYLYYKAKLEYQSSQNIGTNLYNISLTD